MRLRLLLSVIMITSLVFPVFTRADALPPNQSLLPDKTLNEQFHLSMYKSEAQRASMLSVDISGMPFKQALELTSNQRTLFWHAALTTGDFEPLHTGDICLIQFMARTIRSEQEDGGGTIMVFVQQNNRPFNPSIMETVTFGDQWTQINLPFRIQQSYPSNADQLTFGFGEAVQTIQLAGIRFLRLPKDTPLHTLPVYRSTYNGREPDAPWRQAALKRIKQLRTVPTTVTVLDTAGKPVSNASVRVQMQKHAFTFGSAVRTDMMNQNSLDAQRYRQAIMENFNTVSVANALKWGRWENADLRPNTMQCLKWLNEQNLKIHGHVLVWPSWDKSRVNLSSQRKAAKAGNLVPLRERINEHIKEITTETAGLVDDWDVINEPWNNHDFMDLLGEHEMVSWFKQARQYAPNCRLFINDFGILAGYGDQGKEHRDTYEKVIRYLVDHNTPLDAIGMQAHFGSGGLNAPEKLQHILDRFAAFKKPIMITEYDLMTQDEQLQADYTRDLMILAFAHPSVDGFIMWGFWDGMHWRGNSPMYRKDWTLKPSGEVYKQLVLKDWWTDCTMQTDSQGKVQLNAFMGEYQILVQANEQQILLDTSLNRTSNDVIVKMR